MSKTIVVTGGAGFIGSHFIEKVCAEYATDKIVVIDKMGAGSNVENKFDIPGVDLSYIIEDLRNITSLKDIIGEPIHAIVHFAAESHVDRSISSPVDFINNNILGIMPLLEYVRCNTDCILINVSTDEVYGSLTIDEDPWTEISPIKPRSPYSASKAACDMLCASYSATYGAKCIITRCSNNFGPRQDDEKFIPTIIRSIVNGTPIPIYGLGDNRREWIPVQQHVDLIMQQLDWWFNNTAFRHAGLINVAGGKEVSNMELVNTIHRITGEMGYRTIMEYVSDRKGHDFRYAMKGTSYSHRYDYDAALLNTVKYYIDRYECIKAQVHNKV